ncbi:MAG: hypothetical protein AAF928_02380 [Myxococcota bacterium]
MGAESILLELDALLDEEAAAIARADGTAVETIAHRKLAAVTSLGEVRPRPAPSELAWLRRRLCENAVRLAHARHCLLDVVQTLRAPGAVVSSGTYGPRGQTLRGRAGMSITV